MWGEESLRNRNKRKEEEGGGGGGGSLVRSHDGTSDASLTKRRVHVCAEVAEHGEREV